MDPALMIGGALAVGTAAAGLRIGASALPLALRAARDLRDYSRSPEAERERRFAARGETILAHPAGSERQTSIVGLEGNTIRHRDGSYSRLYELVLQETMLATDAATDMFCDDLARLLCLPLPKGAILRFRYAVYPDPGEAIARHLDVRHNVGIERIHLPSAQLHDGRIDFYRQVTAAGGFRRERALLEVRIPSLLKSDAPASFSENFFPELAREVLRHGLVGIGDAIQAAWRRSNNDKTVRRLIDDEREAMRAADKHFRTIELHGSSFLRALDRSKTWEALVLSHSLDCRAIPQVPDTPGLDISRYLTRERIRDCSWYVTHGSIPVTMVSVFTPPNPHVYADTPRVVLANPELTFRHTWLTTFVVLDKAEARKELRKRIKAVQIAKDGFKLSPRQGVDHDAEKALGDLDRVLYSVAGTNEALVRCDLTLLVYGDRARNRAELDASLKQLDENTERLIRSVLAMDGAEAYREDAEALHCLYERSLVGQADPTPSGREVMEVASSLVALVGRERAVAGSPRPHTIMSTASGRLIGVDVFDKNLLRSPIVLFLAAPGSGKTTLVAMIVNDALATVPDLQVSILDNGGTLAPWAEVVGARRLALSAGDDRTFNSFDYPGLHQGDKPDEADITLATMDAMTLAGYPLEDRDAADLIAHAVRVLLQRKADLNAVEEEKTEPTIRDLAVQLENYPSKHEELKASAARIATRLRKYVGNPWLDAPTHAEFKRDTRCDVYDLATLDGFDPDVRRALAGRMAARVLRSNCARRADGTKISAIQAFVEVWKIVAEYPDLLKVINQGGRTGRRDNVVTLLDTHHYDDLKDCRDIAATAGLRFIGPQNKSFDSLIQDSQLNDRAVAAIRSIKNIDGLYTQWVMVAGTGHAQRVEKVQADLSPTEFWTWANNPNEWNARQRVLARRPDWTMGEAVAWLATYYPRGLQAEGLTAIDERLLA
ncbi:MAG TPA: hypothetical protein VIE89_15200 [Candidatus Binatia bacterium]